MYVCIFLDRFYSCTKEQSNYKYIHINSTPDSRVFLWERNSRVFIYFRVNHTRDGSI